MRVTLLTQFSALVLTLIILLPVHPSREKEAWPVYARALRGTIAGLGLSKLLGSRSAVAGWYFLCFGR